MRQVNVTSITTIANEYASDFSVGWENLTLSWAFAFAENARSSGARQRVEHLPFVVRVIDESPKSVRRGLPVGSIRMFDCLSDSTGWRKERGIETYAL